MSDPFTGEIRPFAFTYAPLDWAVCAGQPQLISQNEKLYSILGTRFGGDGLTTFNLPNLQGRSAMGSGSAPGLTPRALGQTTGSETETLRAAQLPVHGHAVNVSDANGSTESPLDAYWARGVGTGPRSKEVLTYASEAAVKMSSEVIGHTGGGQGHSNMQPYLAVNLCICLFGEYPQRP